MQLINASQLTPSQKKDLINRCKASARMRKGQSSTDTIDFELKDCTIKGRLIQNCKAFAIESVIPENKED